MFLLGLVAGCTFWRGVNSSTTKGIVAVKIEPISASEDCISLPETQFDRSSTPQKRKCL
jgi:hypothetical protein